MKNKIKILILSLVFTILQVSLYMRDIKINLHFLFLVYLIFFNDINHALLVVGIGGLLTDLFTLSFGAHFVSFLIVALVLYYFYHNILPNGRLITYLLLNFLGFIVFHISYYLFNILIKVLSSGDYFFKWNVAFKDFLIALFINLIISLIIYKLVHLFSRKTKNKFIMIDA